MQIQIDGQGIEVTPALRELTLKKVDRCLAYFGKINNVHIIYKIDNEVEQTASATVSVPGSMINAHAKSEDMYKTLDILMHNLETQLKKYREKMAKNHRG